MKGRRIVNASIDPMVDDDGEWLTLTFGEVDPSVSSFEAAFIDPDPNDSD